MRPFTSSLSVFDQFVWKQHSGYWVSPRKSEALVLFNHRPGDLGEVNSSNTNILPKEDIWSSEFSLLDIHRSTKITQFSTSPSSAKIRFYDWKAGSPGRVEDFSPVKAFGPERSSKQWSLGTVLSNQLWVDLAGASSCSWCLSVQNPWALRVASDSVHACLSFLPRAIWLDGAQQSFVTGLRSSCSRRCPRFPIIFFPKIKKPPRPQLSVTHLRTSSF